MNRFSPREVSQETLCAVPKRFPRLTTLTMRHASHVSLHCLTSLPLTSLKIEFGHFQVEDFTLKGFDRLEKLILRSSIVCDKSKERVMHCFVDAGKDLAYCRNLREVELAELQGNNVSATNILCEAYFTQLKHLHNTTRTTADGERVRNRLDLLLVDSNVDCLPGKKEAFCDILLEAGEYAPRIAEQIVHDIKAPFDNTKRRELPARRKKYELARRHFLYENGVCVHERLNRLGFVGFMKRTFRKMFKR